MGEDTMWSDAMSGGFGMLSLVVWVLLVVAWWKVFTKAGQPGWAAIIPLYNLVVLMQIVGVSPWLVLAMLIPGVNVIVWIYVAHRLSRSFGYDVGFTIGLILLAPVFKLILGFGPATYKGAPA